MLNNKTTNSSSYIQTRLKLNGATNWTNFVHDEINGMLLAEYTLISGSLTIKCLYTNGLGLISTNREGTKRYFHFDGLGSTWALTDENEVVKDNYVYSAFGVTISATSTNGPSTNPNRFVGRWGYYDDGAMGSASELLRAFGNYLLPASGLYMLNGSEGFNWAVSGWFGGADPMQRGGSRVKAKPCSWRGWFACYWQQCKPRRKYPVLCLEFTDPYWVKCVCYGTVKNVHEPIRWPDYLECVAFCTLINCSGIPIEFYWECFLECAAECAQLVNQPWDRKLGKPIPRVGLTV